MRAMPILIALLARQSRNGFFSSFPSIYPWYLSARREPNCPCRDRHRGSSISSSPSFTPFLTCDSSSYHTLPTAYSPVSFNGGCLTPTPVSGHTLVSHPSASTQYLRLHSTPPETPPDTGTLLPQLPPDSSCGSLIVQSRVPALAVLNLRQRQRLTPPNPAPFLSHSGMQLMKVPGK